MELHEWTLRFFTSLCLFRSDVDSSYRHTKGKSKTVPLHVMKQYGRYGIIVPLNGKISTICK